MSGSVGSTMRRSLMQIVHKASGMMDPCFGRLRRPGHLLQSDVGSGQAALGATLGLPYSQWSLRGPYAIHSQKLSCGVLWNHGGGRPIVRRVLSGLRQLDGKGLGQILLPALFSTPVLQVFPYLYLSHTCSSLSFISLLLTYLSFTHTCTSHTPAAHSAPSSQRYKHFLCLGDFPTNIPTGESCLVAINFHRSSVFSVPLELLVDPESLYPDLILVPPSSHQ